RGTCLGRGHDQLRDPFAIVAGTGAPVFLVPWEASIVTISLDGCPQRARKLSILGFWRNDVDRWNSSHVDITADPAVAPSCRLEWIAQFNPLRKNSSSR